MTNLTSSNLSGGVLQSSLAGSASAATPQSAPTTGVFSWSGTRNWSSRGIFALLDQGLISGSNFLIAILLARKLTAQGYGAFALAFEVFLFLAVVNGALVLEPLSVFGSSVYRDRLRAYLGRLLHLHGLIAILLLVATGCAAWVMHILSPGSGLPSALIGVAIAAPCLLLFWLARRYFYVKLTPAQAARGAVVYCLVLVLGLGIVHHFGLLSALSGFLLMAAGAAATAPMMLARMKPRFAAPNSEAPSLSEVVRRHWNYGRWALGSAVMVWLSSAIFYPLLASFHGLADAGEMKALMNFSSPIGQAFAAFSLLSLPYAASVHYQDRGAGNRRLARRLVVLYGGGTVLYWSVVIALRGPLVTHLYAGKYFNLIALLPWLALASVLRISATAHAITLRAMHSPALVFVAYSAASVVAIVVGIPCMWLYGLGGAVMTLVISSAVALIAAWFMVHRRTAHPVSS